MTKKNKGLANGDSIVDNTYVKQRNSGFSWSKLILFLFVLSRLYKYAVPYIDTQIDGNWSQYPPFSFFD